MKATLAISAIVMTVGIVSLPVVFSDNDGNWRDDEQHSSDVANVSHPVYREECGSCHMAYPPGLLPATSWERMMNGLEDHFGDNAELDKQRHNEVSEFLTANSADKSNYRRSRKFMKDIDPDKATMRITELPYFRHEHDEIPSRIFKGNEKLSSISQCNTCHKKAEQGSFNEDDINIPGYGQWDD